MKINLLLNNPNNVLNGYVNIDPFADGSDIRVAGNVTDLTTEEKEEIVCDGEAKEIIAYGILEYFNLGQIEYILNCWSKKLAVGGKLVVSVVDFEEVARGVVFGNLRNFVQLNHLLHGAQAENWDSKKTTLSLNIIVELLENRGLRVTKKLNENFCSIVESVR